MSSTTAHKVQLLGIAKTWACKALPGWDDAAHRDLIARHGAVALPGTPGRVTASSMSPAQLEAALDAYAARGWPRVHGQHVTRAGSERAVGAVPPRIATIVRLWGRLGQAGKVANANRAALLAWCERQVGRAVPNLDALTVAECQAVTEALKGWAGR